MRNGVGRLTFLELAVLVLEDSQEPLSYREIWGIALTRGYVGRLGSYGATPWVTLRAILGRETASGSRSRIVTHPGKPARFSLR